MTAELDRLRAELDAERLEARRAQARANEAARLSADARDEVADRNRTIADLRERVGNLEQDRLDRDAWAVNLAAKHHAGYCEQPGDDPFEAIEDALVGAAEAHEDDRWHRAVLRRHMAANGLEDPTWRNLSEREKQVLRDADERVIAESGRRLPVGMSAA